MPRTNKLVVMAAAMLTLGAAASHADAQTPGTTEVVEVRGGSVRFHVATNVSAISVHGRSNGLDAQVRVSQGPDGTVLENVEALVSVDTLGTGMGLRDEHMRKHVFTSADGRRPDVTFAAKRTTCALASAGPSRGCTMHGDLTIRGVTRPFTIALEVSDKGKSTFRVAGEAVIKLSAYGIEQLSQLGVRTADDVKLEIEFTARPAQQMATNAGGVR